ESTSRSTPQQTSRVHSGYYNYHLKGIVAHQGTAVSGHYYSYIRVDGEQWMEFNDRIVRPFDPVNIPLECFGG
ncbi:unnamed protein product, partial [Choristocarpus tenellus]